MASDTPASTGARMLTEAPEAEDGGDPALQRRWLASRTAHVPVGHFRYHFGPT
jgi:hypothetical protein